MPPSHSSDPGPKPPRRRRNWKLRFVLLALVMLVLAGVGGALSWFVQRHQPLLDGTRAHPSLAATATVVRDTWGVPHITAENAHDAYFAYGFAIAQDRLFQMEILRRVARGQLAEIAGPDVVEMDKVARTLMFSKKADEYLALHKGIDPEFLGVLDAFLEGVNHCIESQPLPIEFSVMQLIPRPFTRGDCLALTGFMAYGFAEGIVGDSLYATVTAKLPGADVDALFPRYSRERPVTIMEGTTEPPPSTNTPTLGSATPVAAPGADAVARAVAETLDIFPGFRGSNSWVLGPSRTVSGKAVLANDPHIGFGNPHVWYEAHIKYGDFESYGVHLPLVPSVMIGFNSIKAWAITMFENDDTDLYREEFHPADASKVKYKGEWIAVDQWTETIGVKGQAPVEMSVIVTPHGPIVTGFLEGYEGPPLSLWWGYLQAEDIAPETFYYLGLARTYEEFLAAASRLAAPGLNLSYADAVGNIGWCAAGRLPIRPAHVTGKTVLDGASGADEMLGFVEFKDNPQLYNPPSGVIVTANNQSTVKSVGKIPALEGYWQPSDRAARIEYLLAQQEKWDLGSLKAVQTDILTHSAPPIVEEILAAIAVETEPSEQERQAAEALRTWNFANDIESIGASVYHETCVSILRLGVADEFGPDAFRVYAGLAESFSFRKHFVQDDASAFWDNIDTETRETRTEVIRDAFRDAVARLRRERGDNPGDWRWGNLHTIEYKHALGEAWPLNYIFNIGPFPGPGATETINNMQSREDFDILSGPSMRLLVDFADVTAAESILPTGNSGNRFSPNFSDQAAMFLRGEYRRLNVSDAQVAAATQHTLTFNPGPG